MTRKISIHIHDAYNASEPRDNNGRWKNGIALRGKSDFPSHLHHHFMQGVKFHGMGLENMGSPYDEKDQTEAFEAGIAFSKRHPRGNMSIPDVLTGPTSRKR